VGLDTTHDCWHGAYSSFGIWRNAICEAAGFGPLRNYAGFGGILAFPPDDALTALLDHSDCDGDLKWEICGRLADRLEELVQKVREDHDCYLASKTWQFIKGLRRAHEARENVEFR
jgi:hypothetical protein